MTPLQTTEAERQRVEEAAKTATPGPWHFQPHMGGEWFGNIVSYGLGKTENGVQQIRTIDCLRKGAPQAELESTAKLIADCHPDFVLRLLSDFRTLHDALQTIRDMPIAEQDNMIAANMRKIAQAALSQSRQQAATRGDGE